MKIYTRKKFTCIKDLPCGVKEIFDVIVLKENYDTAKKNYESLGYKVL